MPVLGMVLVTTATLKLSLIHIFPGSAEETLGRVLKTDLAPYRDELIISTKAGYGMWPGPYGDWGSRKYMLASLDQSLKRLGLEYVDIFYSRCV